MRSAARRTLPAAGRQDSALALGTREILTVTVDEHLYATACQTAPDDQVWYGPDDIGPLDLRPGVDPLNVGLDRPKN